MSRRITGGARPRTLAIVRPPRPHSFDTSHWVVDRLDVHGSVVASVLAATLCSAASLAARGDDLGELDKAQSAYVAHRYADAEERLRVLLDPKTGSLTSPYDLADARMYLGAVLVAQGRKEAADSVFEQLLLAKPDYQPDPLRIALEAIDVFIDTRSRLRDRLGTLQAELVKQQREQRSKDEAVRRELLARQALLEKLASEDLIVVQPTSRWIAMLPFGAGQFQNGQDGLGWVFLGGESLLAVGSGVAGVLSLYATAQTNEAIERNDGTASAYNRRAQDESIAGNLLAGGFFAAAIVGIVQAQLMFVPQRRHVQHRELPPPPRVSLWPEMSPGGLGIAGKF
ncbi:MAG: hypothetical protein ABTD50_16990 [Polyangiaceae bacterium]